jgi:hypothetical protein
MPSDGLTFNQAVGRFRAFLAAEGWPTTIRWVAPAEVMREQQGRFVVTGLRDDHESQAEKEYDAAGHRRLGVCFDAVCTIDETTCAMVLAPADALDAELQMYPSDGGLKLSAAMPRSEGRAP